MIYGPYLKNEKTPFDFERELEISNFIKHQYQIPEIHDHCIEYWPKLSTYTIASTMDYGVNTSFGYLTSLTNLRLTSKSFLAIKDIKKPLLHAKFRTDWFETVENRSDPK